MKHITGSNFSIENTCTAFGRFDGLHRGHRSIIRAVTEAASASDLNPILLSLYDNSRSRTEDLPAIYTEEEKKLLLEASGLDTLLSIPYSEEIRNLEPEVFITEIILKKLGARVIAVGEDCRFGAGGLGDTDLLKRLSVKHGFELIVCETVRQADAPVASDMVRNLLSGCDMLKAAELLEHPFSILGPIVHGKALGRTAKLPTANIAYGKNKLIPPHGIYATLAHVEGKPYRGMSIIGLRPTVDNLPDVTVETYLLDFSGDLYGRQMLLEVHMKVREIRKFRDLHEVRIQVDRDIESVREYLDGMV